MDILFEKLVGYKLFPENCYEEPKNNEIHEIIDFNVYFTNNKIINK